MYYVYKYIDIQSILTFLCKEIQKKNPPQICGGFEIASQDIISCVLR